MKPAEAKAAVAAEQGKTPQQYRASRAPAGSIHEGLWYVSERDFDEMPIDDCTWIVFPDGFVTRGIPVGNPVNPPTTPDELRPRSKDLDDPEAPWNWDTVSRAGAEAEVAKSPLTLYPYRGDWFTYEEFTDWVPGGLSLYQAVEVRLTIATEFTDGQHRWTKEQLRENLFPSDVTDGGFEEWLSAALKSGELTTVEFLQYITEGHSDGDADREPSGVVMQRRIVDEKRPTKGEPE